MTEELLRAAGLGALQGVTEFLPVSSSGHLALAEKAFGLDAAEWVAFDVAVHVATLVVVAVSFRREIVKLLTTDRKLLWLIAVGSVPAAAVGLLWQDRIAEAKSFLPALAGAFLVTAIILVVGERVSKRFVERFEGTFEGSGRPMETIGLVDTVLIGVMQAVAIMPGVSRSGATIGAGLARGIDRKAAVAYSFLLSMPAIGGAALLKAREIGDFAAGRGAELAAGFVAALVTGWLALALLKYVAVKGKLHCFAGYCAVLAVATMAVWALQ